MQNRLAKIFVVINALGLLALSSTSSIAKSSENYLEVSRISWAQLPVSVQDYYQANYKTDKLNFSAQDVVAIKTWHDTNGANYLLQFQRIQPVTDMKYYTRKGEVAAHLYSESDNDSDSDKELKRLWQVYDYISCDLDLIANFGETLSEVSDINANGMAEVGLPYYLGCRGDVSYDGMKVIMYEGHQKFAMRGNSAICNTKTGLPVDTTGYYGGEYKIDDKLLQQSKLKNAEQVLFKNHLRSMWQDNQCSIYFNYDNG